MNHFVRRVKIILGGSMLSTLSTMYCVTRGGIIIRTSSSSYLSKSGIGPIPGTPCSQGLHHTSSASILLSRGATHLEAKCHALGSSLPSGLYQVSRGGSRDASPPRVIWGPILLLARPSLSILKIDPLYDITTSLKSSMPSRPCFSSRLWFHSCLAHSLWLNLSPSFVGSRKSLRVRGDGKPLNSTPWHAGLSLCFVIVRISS